MSRFNFFNYSWSPKLRFEAINFAAFCGESRNDSNFFILIGEFIDKPGEMLNNMGREFEAYFTESELMNLHRVLRETEDEEKAENSN